MKNVFKNIKNFNFELRKMSITTGKDVHEAIANLVDNLECYIEDLENYVSDLGYSERMRRSEVWNSIDHAKKILEQIGEVTDNFVGVEPDF